MDAVYAIDRDEKKIQGRERVSSASQMNICYEAPNNDYVITTSVQAPKQTANISPRRISSKSVPHSPEKILNNTQINMCYEAPNGDDIIIVTRSNSDSSKRPSRLDLIRKQDDMVTSFQISQGGLVISKPSFTAVTQGSLDPNTNEYSSVETPYTTPDEPAYALPGTENEYDASLSHVVGQKCTECAYDNDYATLRRSVHEYKNIDDVTAQQRRKKVKSEDSKRSKKNEKKKDKGKKTEEENVYENDDTMMVY